MKKLLIAVGVCGLAVLCIAADNIRRTGAGLLIQDSSSGKLGFYGTAPVTKPTGVTNVNANLATLTLSGATITYAGVDGSTNSIYVLTNVAINAVAGYASTNQANAINSALRNLGLAGN
jgi:hypothetical protein